MSHSSSITLAEHRIDLSIRAFLLLVWVGLFIFGILTLIQPEWLQKISKKGRETEALDLKVQGDDFLTEGNYIAAINKYEAALKTDPDLQTALGNMAITYARMGKLGMAERTISQLVKRIPERAWVGYMNLGDIYIERKEFEKARKYFLKARDTSPFPGNASMLAGYCSMQLQETEKALEFYNNAIQDKIDFELLYRGSLQRDHYNYHADEEIVNEIEELLLLGDYSHILNDYDEKTFKQTITREHNIAKIYNNVGIIYYNNGNFAQAEKFFRQALRIDTGFSKARQNLSHAVSRQ